MALAPDLEPKPEDPGDPAAEAVLEVTVERLPHGLSLLEAATQSGHLATVQHVAGLYRERYPHCLAWQCEGRHGLWCDFPEDAQRAIGRALRHQPAPADLPLPRPFGHITSLDLRALRYRSAARPGAIRPRLRTVFQFPDPHTGEWTATAEPVHVPDWDSALVMVSSGQVARATADRAVLAELVEAGVVDPALFAPPCAAPDRLELAPIGGPQQRVLLEVLQAALQPAILGGGPAEKGSAEALALAQATGIFTGRGHRRGSLGARDGDTGIGARLTDGLTDPGGATATPHYDAAYRSDVGTLPFCMRLPENPLGLQFAAPALLEMCADALLKAEELRRQRFLLDPWHAVTVYVYTYELPNDDAGDQIYGAMNRAMRLRDMEGVAFWRPLIWQLDIALQVPMDFAPPPSCVLCQRLFVAHAFA